MTLQTRQIEKSPNAYGYPLLLKNILRTPLIYSPDQEIVYRDKKRMTYRDLAARVSQLGSGLLAMGVKPGDVIGIMDWDSDRYLASYFAVPGVGAVMHTINVRLSPEQVLWTMNHAEDAVVFVHEDFIPIVEAIKDQAKTVKKWILIKETDAPVKSSVAFDCEFEEILAKGAADYEFPDFDENTMATLFYTTGTTGDPKGVYFSHRQLMLHTLAMSVATGAFAGNGRIRSDDVYMPITPMFHVHAWGVPYVATMLGIKQVYPGRYEPEMLLRLLISEKVTFSHCVPTILHMLVSSPVAKKVDLRGWKVIIGGSALPRGLAKAAMELGIDIYTGYGMSETCPLLTLSALSPDMLDLDTEAQLDFRTKTGRAVPLVDIRIVDPMMKDTPKDNQTAGEIVVRTPWLTQGYYKNPDKGKELWEGGYLHTGDVAVIDDKGWIRITDRIKDVIKTGGEWISSLELESLISQTPGVSEVAVVGVPHEKWGERPVAMVVALPEANGEALAEAIKNHLAKFVDDGTISKWAIPEQINVVAAIPKTSVGKIDKKVIRAELAKK